MKELLVKTKDLLLNGKKYFLWFGLVVLVIFVGWGLGRMNNKGNFVNKLGQIGIKWGETKPLTVEKLEENVAFRPSPLIDGEPVNFDLNLSDNRNPKLKKGYISIYRASIDEIQDFKFSYQKSGEDEIKKAWVDLERDGVIYKIELTKDKNDAVLMDTEVWSGSWKSKGSTKNSYSMKVTAESNDNKSEYQIQLK